MQRGKAQTKLTGGYNYKMLIKRCMGTFLLERVSYFFLFFLRNGKKKKTVDYTYIIKCRVGVTDLTFMQLGINGSLRLSLRLDGSMVGTGCAARYNLRRRRRERRCPLTTPYRYCLVCKYSECTCTCIIEQKYIEYMYRYL